MEVYVIPVYPFLPAFLPLRKQSFALYPRKNSNRTFLHSIPHLPALGPGSVRQSWHFLPSLNTASETNSTQQDGPSPPTD